MGTTPFFVFLMFPWHSKTFPSEKHPQKSTRLKDCWLRDVPPSRRHRWTLPCRPFILMVTGLKWHKMKFSVWNFQEVTEQLLFVQRQSEYIMCVPKCVLLSVSAGFVWQQWCNDSCRLSVRQCCHNNDICTTLISMICVHRGEIIESGWRND